GDVVLIVRALGGRRALRITQRCGAIRKARIDVKLLAPVNVPTDLWQSSQLAHVQYKATGRRPQFAADPSAGDVFLVLALRPHLLAPRPVCLQLGSVQE